MKTSSDFTVAEQQRLSRDPVDRIQQIEDSWFARLWPVGEGCMFWTKVTDIDGEILTGIVHSVADHDDDDAIVCPSSNKWDRCLVLLRECFAHHFHVTRRVVDSANDVSR